MIITFEDSYDKQKGTKLPMLSRSGKSTIDQYLVFGKEKKRSIDSGVFSSNQQPQEDLEVEPDDLEMIMGDKPNNIEQEM